MHPLALPMFLALLMQAGPDADPSDREAAERLEFMKESVTRYRVTPDAVGGRSFELHSAPLLRWNNPVSSVKDGTVYIWTGRAGRPEAAVQVFTAAGNDKLWLHEFQSLSGNPFTVSVAGEAVWTPRRAGVRMRALPDAPPPADAPAGRLIQMRQLADRLTASDDFEGKSRWELRLLRKPLHRYGAPEGDIADGALFAFAHGTDPEVLLLLEARRTEAGLEWHYGLAPMTGYAVRVSRDGEEIWSAPWRKGPFHPDEPFFILKYQP